MRYLRDLVHICLVNEFIFAQMPLREGSSRMQNSQILIHLLSSLELAYFQCGTTKLGMKTHTQFIASIHIQPFALVTRITDGAVVVGIDNASYKVEPGQALIIPANVKYTFHLLGDTAVTHWLNFNFTLFEHFPLLDLLETPYTTSDAIGNEIGQLQAEISDLVHAKHTNNSAALFAAAKVKQRLFSVLEIVMSISRHKAGSLEKMNKFQKFQPVFKYIEEHLDEKIKVSQLAGLLFVSTSHFYKEFQDSFDLSPMQYIQSQRFKKAQYLLSTSDLTVREIANLVGYDSTFPFIRFFKSMYGNSPGHYRKMMLNRY
ncbi:helix-turn-helix domain-containing protein [Paenibacillus hemerocallicola]|uniref:Helix-turn-helix domain-containing protein n=2 Tax=Paenibacillus hemerocallicola TaxID=1172614 RepID=A0A5C4TA80_9BACL|nr:helix-turn-helix domain-containing protein [Paenibacillus hemerocallicola]